jgi:tetratricopeptide (TPR) repeat protein
LKNYTHYTKPQKPYFNLSEFLFFPVAPLLAIAVLSYLILYFLGSIAAIIAMVAVAFVGNTIYQGFKGFSPNGGNSRRRPTLAGSVFPFLIILGSELIVSIGPYIVVTSQKTGIFYNWYFVGWLFVVLGIPTLYFMIRELTYARLVAFQEKHFIPLHLSITHDAELLVYIEKIAFLNTQKKLSGHVDINDYVALPHPDQFRRLSQEDRNRYYYSRIFSDTVHLPKETNRMLLVWYTATENVYYQGEIDFPYSKIFHEKNDTSSTQPITLSIREEGRIQLYHRGGTIVEPATISALPQNKKKDGRYIHWSRQNNTIEQEEFPMMLERVKQRTLLADFVCNWQLTGSSLEGHNLLIETVQTHEDFGNSVAPDLFVRRTLPIQMTFSYERYSWISFYIDAEKLYEQLKNAKLTNTDITFDISLNIEKGDASLLIKSGDTEFPFTAFEKKIAPQSLETVQELFQKTQAEKAKNDLWKRIFELIQRKAYNEAQELCTEALRQYPNFVLIYFYEARLLWYTQGYEASYAQESYFLEKTKYNPFALARIYNHYGCLLDEQKRYPEALSYFEKAAATYPEEIIYTANIAEIYYRMENHQKALHYADECTLKGYTSDIISEILALRNA